MKVNRLIRTSTFQLALVYMALFATSVFILLGFIYWATAGYMADQTDETIEAEVLGLAEQYQRHGLNGLVSVIRERVNRDPNGKSIYLFTARNQVKLAGNLDQWPAEVLEKDGWINFIIPGGKNATGKRLIRGRVFIVQRELSLLVGRDVEELMTVKRLIERAFTWGMAMTLALALIGGLMMTRSTVRRIEMINATSRRIMNGNLGLRIPTRGTHDDFDQLAENLNLMLDRIVQLMEGVRHVSDNIAHDLKTPLTRLKNQLETTLLVVKSPEGQEQVSKALAEADQMLGTFNALLRIARLESGGKLSHAVDVNLQSLIEDAVDFYEVLAEEKQQSIHFIVEGNCTVWGDKDLLFQAVSNLIDNAIKYTQVGGRVDISLKSDEACSLVTLSVGDNGIGIPAEERDKVFQRFYRVAKSRSEPGNGLGLSLVAAIFDLHEASISLHDNQPGLRVEISFKVKKSEKNRLVGKKAVGTNTLEILPAKK
ncbi:MAG: HAMP domain-containing histidine kinase [Hahellaceae bacterium]|nr:HAMP domain-containing histidine kinase [Hahellaceae bacterium]MCP5210225.1 HAMP domain-containing histidine kinase [Hahellaceae bacterium]